MLAGIILLLVLAFIFAVFIYAQNSKKDTTVERYGEAVSTVTKLAADEVSNFARNITEPPSKKKIRIAKEELYKKLSYLYNLNVYWTYKTFEVISYVDDNVAKHLSVLGLSEQRWKQIAYDVFCIGVIQFESRDNNRSRKNSKEDRERTLNSNYDDSNKSIKNVLKDCLSHFQIPESEWIEYGDAVLEMHNIIENLNLNEIFNN